jgi:hypothetical protein
MQAHGASCQRPARAFPLGTKLSILVDDAAVCTPHRPVSDSMKRADNEDAGIRPEKAGGLVTRGLQGAKDDGEDESCEDTEGAADLLVPAGGRG